MAKARPKIPGFPANDAAHDPAPSPGNISPSQRKPVFEQITDVILAEWRAAILAGRRPLDRQLLEMQIGPLLRLLPASADPLGGDPDGEVEIGVIVDPPPQPGKKFVWIVIPYPDAPGNMPVGQWIDEHGKAAVKYRLGESILYGCGK
jgi:hypothetical protein